jgi:hypothetical protein
MKLNVSYNINEYDHHWSQQINCVPIFFQVKYVYCAGTPAFC